MGSGGGRKLHAEPGLTEKADETKENAQHFIERIHPRRRPQRGLPAAAQDAKQPYATMASLEQYLMDRNAEIALARSAAPDAISHDATFIFLRRHGYETAVEGKKGWACMVERSWLAPFDSPEF